MRSNATSLGTRFPQYEAEVASGGATNLGFFLAGLGVGAIVALLLAPKSGKEAREYIAGKAGEGRDYVKAKTNDLRRQAEDAVRKAKIL